jgi:methylglutaconyl-CoA hydratase
MLRAIDEFPAPVVARVNGHAIGGAAGLLGCVDVAVAVRGAKLAFTEVRVGIAPAMISAYVQPRIGVRHARRYFLTGERFDADRALHIGLVSDVCAREDLDATVGDVVAQLLAAAPGAQRETKALIREIDRLDREASQELRLELIARLRAGEEGQEGMRAFFDKRPASRDVQTKALWVYDYRTNVHKTLKTKRLTSADLDDFFFDDENLS